MPDRRARKVLSFPLETPLRSPVLRRAVRIVFQPIREVPMKAARSLCLLSAVLLAVGCSDSPTEPGSQTLSADELEGGAGKVAVVTRNLYVGTDVDAVIAALAGGGDPQPALIQAIETLGKTNFPARAAAIADEIAKTRPHAIGLQEVSK